MQSRPVCCILDLRHGRARSADRSDAAAAHLSEREEETATQRDPKEPHEDVARLELPAAALGIVGAESDPAGGAVGGVGAVDVANLGGEDNGADKGEEHAEAVEDHEDEGHGEAGEDGGENAVEADNPGEDGDEHGKVDGGAGRGGGGVIAGDDVADEAGDDDCEDERDAAQDDVEEARHGDGLFLCLMYY